MTGDIPAGYDAIAQLYDATRGWPPDVAGQVGAGLRDLLHDVSGGTPLRVLEVGAGTGRALLPLAQAGAWTVGLDAAPRMLAALRGKAATATGPGVIRVVLGDALRLPFADSSFDVALLAHILHLLPDWRVALAEARRCVRPGGGLAFGLDAEGPNEARLIEARGAAILRELGASYGASEREAVTRRALLALEHEGYALRSATLARWTEIRTPAQVLQAWRARAYPALWDVPGPVLEAALARLERELRARFGALDSPLPVERWFRATLATRR